MKRAVIIVLTAAFVFLGSSLLKAGEFSVKSTGAGEWKFYDDGDFLGSLRKTDEGKLALADKNGSYVGLMDKGGGLFFDHRHPTLTPDVGQLYLQAVEVVRNMK